MAQTGYTPILIYSSSTAAAAPVAGNLTNSTLGSELAINITDGKLFYKDNANVIQVIGWKVVPATAGGTGQTSYTQGDLLYATSSTTLGRLADVVTGNALISGGVGGDPAWGKIGLTTHVSGVLPTANGGTNLSSFTANGVVYASSTTALATSSNFSFDGTNLLHVSNGSAKLRLGLTTSSQYVDIYRDSATGSTVYDAAQGAPFRAHVWQLGGIEAARIHSSGGVSIGNTTDPGATNLFVSGSIGAGASPGTKIDAYASGTTSTVVRARNDTTTVYMDANNAYGYLNVFTNHPLLFGTNNTERARFTAAGGFTCAGIYSTIVGATNRDVFVDNTGVVGYVSSTRASKTNIQDLVDTDWLYQLNPVTFNYRKRDDEEQYTDEIDGDIQYGMIAEDVEQVRPDLCFYDEINGEKELRGIQYSKLVPVMLKAMQELKTQLDEAKAEINALKGNA